ncbi:MAG: hypothetical protein IID32_06155, partial [Planctomycetes bacterium]|nr:hypothetical protein [Planctomycetota bacterium]
TATISTTVFNPDLIAQPGPQPDSQPVEASDPVDEPVVSPVTQPVVTPDTDDQTEPTLDPDSTTPVDTPSGPTVSNGVGNDDSFDPENLAILDPADNINILPADISLGGLEDQAEITFESASPDLSGSLVDVELDPQDTNYPLEDGLEINVPVWDLPDSDNANFNEFFTEVHSDWQLTDTPDNPGVQLENDSDDSPQSLDQSTEVFAGAAQTGFVAGLWGLLRNAVGVTSRVDENPDNANASK